MQAMTSEELITQLSPNESNPHFQLGYLSGTCKGAIIELETFIENRSEILSESDIYYLKHTIESIKKGLIRTGLNSNS
jgi:hypothetical protein